MNLEDDPPREEDGYCNPSGDEMGVYKNNDSMLWLGLIFAAIVSVIIMFYTLT